MTAPIYGRHGAVDLIDALILLKSFGHVCAA